MRPHGRARINARSPRALAVCDRCGFLYNHIDLNWQFQWQGPKLQNLRKLVCQTCMDVPQEQLRTIILPPDPIPIENPRPEAYNIEVSNFMSTVGGDNFITMGSSANIIGMIKVVSYPNDPPGFTYEGGIV